MKRFFTPFALSFLFAASALFPSYAESTPKIESFSLANGLQVVVIENHRIPAVSHMLWFRVGAADDPQGKSGLAHYHEHAMFLGTKKYGPGQYSNIIMKNGGQQNAFTGYDATSYYINIHKSELPLAMELEADRLRGLAASEADMEKEKQVIIEERRARIENNPQALLEEQMNAALFRHHPYKTPVIGWMHEMQGLTRQDVMDFHQRWYHPNNAVLVISGDITPGEVRPLAQKYYGGLARGKLPARRWNVEPPQNTERHLVMHHKNVKQPQLRRSYMASSLGFGKKDASPALFVLSQLLGGGKTSRLYQSLVVEQKLAASIDTGYNAFAIGPAEFSILITPEKDISLEALEKALEYELQKFSPENITDKELETAKTQLKAEAIYARDGLSGMAHIMGWLVIAGLDKDYFSRWPSLIEAVSKSQLAQAAKDTLTDQQSVTAYLLPGKVEDEKKEQKK